MDGLVLVGETCVALTYSELGTLVLDFYYSSLINYDHNEWALVDTGELPKNLPRHNSLLQSIRSLSVHHFQK